MKISVDRLYKKKNCLYWELSQKDKGISLESRHLGLYSTLEKKTLYKKIQKISKVISKNIDINKIIKILKNTSDFSKKPNHVSKKPKNYSLQWLWIHHLISIIKII